MNAVSKSLVRRLARPHVLALAAALALPAGAGAQVNSWLCAGGGWTGDTACWSRNQTPNATQDVAINGGPTDTNLMLLFAIGNNIAARSVTLGTDRTAPAAAATAQLYLSGTTLTVGGTNPPATAGFVGVGTGANANAELNLTNNSRLDFLPGAFNNPGVLELGGNTQIQGGYGAMTVQGGARVTGLPAIRVLNGRLDVLGSNAPGYVAIDGSVSLLGFGAANVANIAASVGSVGAGNGRATLGTLTPGFQTPIFGTASAGGTTGAIDFVGRSAVGQLIATNQGTVSIKGGATVDNTSGSAVLTTGGVLNVDQGGTLNTRDVLRNESGSLIQMSGGTINHQGVNNSARISGFGLIDSVLDNQAQAFTHQAGGSLTARGGNLEIYGQFDGSRGGAIETVGNAQLYFRNGAVFKAGQVITQSGPGDGFVIFSGNIDIGTSTERGQLRLMSPAAALQNTSNLFLDFGPGVGDFDNLSTAGRLLVEGGTLTLRTAGSFQAGVGNIYSILGATGGITGTFGTINTTGFALAPGARLDISNLYTNGTLAVVAVPEPATWLSLGAGLLLMAARARRWRQEV